MYWDANYSNMNRYSGDLLSDIKHHILVHKDDLRMNRNTIAFMNNMQFGKKDYVLKDGHYQAEYSFEIYDEETKETLQFVGPLV